MRLGQTLPLLKENLSFLKFSFFLEPGFRSLNFLLDYSFKPKHNNKKYNILSKKCIYIKKIL